MFELMINHTTCDMYLLRVIAHIIPEMDTLDRRILAYLMKQDWPVTTEMIAKELKISWNTAQVHLWRMVSENLVKGRKVGRQNQWIATKSAENKES